MKSQKRWLIGGAALVAVVLVTLLLLPLVLKGPVATRARAAVNDAVEARVDWSGIGLTFFRDFPNLTLGLDDLAVVGTERFEGDTLATMESFRLVLDAGSVLRSVFGDGAIVVRSVRLEQPAVSLAVLEDGTANWDIARKRPEAAAPRPREQARALNVELQGLEVTDGVVVYRDERSGLYAALEGLRHTLSGNFSRDSLGISTQTHADHTTLRFAGTPWLSGVALDFDADIDADLAGGRFAFRDNVLRLNDLALSFSGDVARAGEAFDVNVALAAEETEFGRILSLVPVVYRNDFASVETSGTFSLEADSLRQPIAVEEAAVRLSPQRSDLDAFRVAIGSSDLQAAGWIENLPGFLFWEQPLRGSATFTSRQFVLDEWKSDDPERKVIVVPPQLDFTLDGGIDRLVYGGLELTGARGRVLVRDQRVTLDGFGFDMLGGRIGITGHYETVDPERPQFAVDLLIDSLDIRSAAEQLLTVRTLAPVAEYARGTFSADLNLSGALGSDLTPLFDVLTGSGSLLTSRISLEDFPPMERLASALSVPQLNSPTLEAIRSSIDIRDARLHVRPVEVGVGDVRMLVSGSNGIDRSLDYTLQLAVPRALLGDGADRVVQDLAGRAGRVGLNLAAADSVRLSARLTGTITQPSIDLGLAEAVASVREQAVQAAGEAVEQRVDEARERLDSAAAETRRQAQARADSIIARAEQQAEAIREEAARLAEQVRVQGNRQADEVIARATNPIARRAAEPVADRLRREADERATGIEQEADERAAALVAEARRRADALVQGVGRGG